MSARSHSQAQPQPTTTIDRRRLLQYGVLAGASVAFQSVLPSAAKAASFVPVFGAARDIGAGANGSVWAIGTNPEPGGFGIYRFNGTSFDQVPGGAVRIAVDPSGNAWVTNALQQIYRFNGAFFEPMPGLARDIGIGADGSVWVIGADPQLGGYGIYRWDGAAWDNVPGGAVRIAVDPTGNAWVTNSLRQIYRYDGASFQLMPGAAFDIGVGGSGSVWVIGADPQLGGYGIYRFDGASWMKVFGGGVNVTVDQVGNAWVTNSLNQIYRWV